MKEVAEDVKTIFDAAVAIRSPTAAAPPSRNDYSFEATEDATSSVTNVSSVSPRVTFTRTE